MTAFSSLRSKLRYTPSGLYFGGLKARRVFSFGDYIFFRERGLFPKPWGIKTSKQRNKQSNKQVMHEEKKKKHLTNRNRGSICERDAWATVHVGSHITKSSWGYGNSHNIFR